MALVTTTSVSAQDSLENSRVFSVHELQTDLVFWRNRLETKHPLIYLYRPKYKVDHFFDSLYFAIDHPMSELEFFKHIAPVSSYLCDGHNTILPSKLTIESIRSDRQLFPFEVEYFDDRLHVIRNVSADEEILEGDEIKEINGIDVLEIRKNIMSLTPHEGHNEQLAVGTINDLFRFYYQLYYGFPDQYDITLQYSDDSQKSFVVPSQNLGEIRAFHEQRYPEDSIRSKHGIYYESFDEAKIGLLTITTFDAEAFKYNNQRFRSEIRRVFREIKHSKTEQLIIDLRDNEGGNPDFVKVLLKHLFDHCFEQAKEFRIVEHPGQEDFERRTEKKWYPWFGIGNFSPANNHFDGKLVVLHNENTFSAAVGVLSVLEKYDRATFIGTESGGNPIVMGGYINKTRWQLPNTSIQISSGVHCTLFNDLDQNTGRGIIPDIEIKRDLFDTLTNYDACLEFTLEYLRDVVRSK